MRGYKMAQKAAASLISIANPPNLGNPALATRPAWLRSLATARPDEDNTGHDGFQELLSDLRESRPTETHDLADGIDGTRGGKG